jgi:peptidoglycan/xylan/chitin deacetylase (PgdA/CDA1 family)
MFDASQSRDPDGTTQSYEWDFGDGEPPVFVDVDLPFIWYAYERPGEYTVTLTVTDNDDLPDTVTRAIKITGKRFMITFDDGPSPESTPYILDQLKGIMNDEGTRVKAGFFLIGEDKSRAPRTGNPIADDWWQCQAYFKLCPDPGVMWNEDIVRRIKKEGHLIGIHTQHHPNLRDLEPADAAWEVLACYDAILKAGVTPPKKVFRPPYLKAPIPLPAALEEGGWSVIQGELTDDWLPEWRPEWLPEWLPSGSEEHVIAKCRDILQQSTDESPTVLIFHDFRGREDYRLDFCNIIVNELVNKDGFVLVDFEY